MSALASRVAAARLSEQEQAALKLSGDGLGYLDIALELGVEREAVAGLLASARMQVRTAVRDTPLPAATGAQCADVLPLLCARQDGERVDAEQRDFLRAHVDSCDHCRATRVALREGTLALRAALEAGPVAFGAVPVVARPAPEAALGRVEEAPPALEAESGLALGAPAAPAEAPAGLVPVAPAAPVEAPAGPEPSRAAPAQPAAPSRRRRRRAPAVAAVAALAACVATFATIFVGGDDPQRSSAAEPAATPAATATPSPAPETTPDRAAAERRAAARRRRQRAAARRRAAARATATPSPTAAAPVATATPGPVATPRPETRRRTRVRREEDDTETRSGKRGAGIPQPSATANPDGTAGGPIRDACTEDNPDCESG